MDALLWRAPARFLARVRGKDRKSQTFARHGFALGRIALSPSFD